MRKTTSIAVSALMAGLGLIVTSAPATAGGCTISGGPAHLLGQAGNDLLLGGSGGDLLKGSGGRDTLISGPGVDALSGGLGADLLDATSGGADAVHGGGGNDTCYVDRHDTVRGCEHTIQPS